MELALDLEILVAELVLGFEVGAVFNLLFDFLDFCLALSDCLRGLLFAGLGIRQLLLVLCKHVLLLFDHSLACFSLFVDLLSSALLVFQLSADLVLSRSLLVEGVFEFSKLALAHLDLSQVYLSLIYSLAH